MEASCHEVWDTGPTHEKPDKESKGGQNPEEEDPQPLPRGGSRETAPDLAAEPAHSNKRSANTDPNDKDEKLVDGGQVLMKVNLQLEAKVLEKFFGGKVST
ncbi:hypothetical protein N7523_000546 [Penicillium sp. IBT 18751x]|nr:hypothetical protein N7523_000546 [Penicillium sp. IBT 18751x]